METDDSMLEQVLGLCESFAAMARSFVDFSFPSDPANGVAEPRALQASSAEAADPI